jgi:hypothetical protein
MYWIWPQRKLLEGINVPAFNDRAMQPKRELAALLGSVTGLHRYGPGYGLGKASGLRYRRAG